jgi:hypothetical protein
LRRNDAQWLLIRPAPELPRKHVHIPDATYPLFLNSTVGSATATRGAPSWVRPFSSRRAFSFWNLPNCLKTKTTHWSLH